LFSRGTTRARYSIAEAGVNLTESGEDFVKDHDGCRGLVLKQAAPEELVGTHP
jgi:hypothetical protein